MAEGSGKERETEPVSADSGGNGWGAPSGPPAAAPGSSQAGPPGRLGVGAALRTGPRSVEVAVTSGSRSGWDVAALVGRRSPPLAAGVSHRHPEVFVSQVKDVDPTDEFAGHPGTQSRTLKQPLF